jgi:hypothetical protein
MNLNLILLSIGGFVFHFLIRWGEHWKTVGKVNPVSFAMIELPNWLAAAVGACSCMLMLQALPLFLGLPPAVLEGNTAIEVIMQGLAFTVGYMGSSIARKVPTWFRRQGKGAQ